MLYEMFVSLWVATVLMIGGWNTIALITGERKWLHLLWGITGFTCIALSGSIIGLSTRTLMGL